MDVTTLSDVSVILPAAGDGLRMNLKQKKQFTKVLGKPLISYTIENFETLEWVCIVVVVVSKDCKILMDEMVKKYGWTKVKVVAEGSFSRHRSIFNAIQALPQLLQREPGIVVVHDAVRPIINPHDLQAVVMAAKSHWAAGLVKKLTSTILEGDSEGVVMLRALDRTALWQSHTPQAFQYPTLKKAYEECSEEELNHGTECLDLVHKHSFPCDPSSAPHPFIRLIQATTFFDKITYQEDLKYFEYSLKAGPDCVQD